MRVILDLDETILGKLEEKAITEKRSRKNYMEYVLENASKDSHVSVDRIINKPTNLPKQNIPIVSQYDAYVFEISTAEDVYFLEGTIKEVLKDKELSNNEKISLQKLATERAQKLQ